jgi:hypothetical protein
MRGQLVVSITTTAIWRTQILLVFQILVSCDQHVEASLLCLGQQVAILELTPVQLERSTDLMWSEMATKGNRSFMVEQDSHSRDFQGPGCVLQNAPGLLCCDPWKPPQKVLHDSTVLDVFEQRGDWHASTANSHAMSGILPVLGEALFHRPVDLIELRAVRNRRLRHYIEQSRSRIYDAA